MTPKDMIARLVAFPTVSNESNLCLIHFVRDFLAGHGVESRIVPSPDGRKANLFATIGPKVEGGIVLSGHTDVVPVADQDWTSDPFALREADGRLYGRGTADMKGFCAIALALVPQMVAAPLKRPLHIALSYDEEPGCLGAPLMIARMVEEIPTPEAVIVGEPTRMKVVTAHKGFINFETRVRGVPVHSSQVDRGVSAVTVAARLVTWLDDRMAENRRSERRDEGFDPAYTTLHCGTIHGGTAHNVVAADCRFVTDIRTIPAEDPRDFHRLYLQHVEREVVPQMRRVSPKAGVRVETIAHVPALRPERDGAAERLARRLTGDNATHVVAYGTEAGQFQDAGYSVVVCGPGSIDQAHQADEFIETDQVEAGRRFLEGLIAHCAA